MTDAYVGVSGIQRILAVHDVALAMVGSAHLARLKAYSCKFVQLVSQRFDPAQQADCRFGKASNDALREFTEIRGELSTLLQACPKALFIPRGPTQKGRANRSVNGRVLARGVAKAQARSPLSRQVALSQLVHRLDFFGFSVLFARCLRVLVHEIPVHHH